MGLEIAVETKNASYWTNYHNWWSNRNGENEIVVPREGDGSYTVNVTGGEPPFTYKIDAVDPVNGDVINLFPSYGPREEREFVFDNLLGLDPIVEKPDYEEEHISIGITVTDATGEQVSLSYEYDSFNPDNPNDFEIVRGDKLLRPNKDIDGPIVGWTAERKVKYISHVLIGNKISLKRFSEKPEVGDVFFIKWSENEDEYAHGKIFHINESVARYKVEYVSARANKIDEQATMTFTQMPNIPSNLVSMELDELYKNKSGEYYLGFYDYYEILGQQAGFKYRLPLWDVPTNGLEWVVKTIKEIRFEDADYFGPIQIPKLTIYGGWGLTLDTDSQPWSGPTIPILIEIEDQYKRKISQVIYFSGE